MRISLYISLLSVLFITSCKDTRIHEHEEWAKYFEEQGIEDGCFIMRDHNHETVHYYNKERSIKRFTPASTFKIFNSLVALEIPKAPDEQFLIPWDSVERRPEWNKDLTMREAFKVSAVPYYQEMARRIGFDYMQHFLDTANYGNRNASGAIDLFWLNDSLQISADEQVGFLKKLYFNELPFSERTQRIVRSMMLQEQEDNYNLYYKTGWGVPPGAQEETVWIVGFIERIEQMQEHENSMNKSDIRKYPYFFALNFSLPINENRDYTKYVALRAEILKNILKDYGAISTKRK